ncbi:MAG: hypothetical protein OEZ22_06950 [Spirochaetia bacterium]|nr:hypothetical protein [Spirochaetia bacterium]
MQDIDFVKILKTKNKIPKKPVYSKKIKRTNSGYNYNKLIIGLGAVVIIFFLGILGGIRWQMHKFDYNKIDLEKNEDLSLSTANINPEINKENNNRSKEEKITLNPGNSTKSPLKFEEDAYLILCRKYSDKKEAHRQGFMLKKTGIPIFLVETGSKMKIYAGPITGKDDAYTLFAKIKAMPEFNGAILYKK